MSRMAQNTRRKGHPLSTGIRHGAAHGKWNSRIICVLAALGTLRYSELRREMGNITDAVLASTLKGLITTGLVARRSYD